MVSIGESVSIVGNGQALPHALLFNVDVYTTRKKIFIRSAERRKSGLEPKLVFNLSGRSDLVALLPGKSNVSRMNIRYVIEVKISGFKINEALNEAYLQLVGLSVNNMNTSPPVILTDLNEEHYVLCLELGDPLALKFKLCIHQFPSLVMCIQRCRALASRPCITARFGSPPTRASSMQGKSSDAAGDEGDDEVDGTLGDCVIKDASQEEN